MADKYDKGKALLQLENVQRAIDAACNWAGAEHGRRLGNFIRMRVYGYRVPEAMESPIEAMFYAWFNAVTSLEDDDVYLFSLTPQVSVQASSGEHYRFDFVVEFGPQLTANFAHQFKIPPPKLAIELDGHDFHERTKEQVAGRNKRDRDLQVDGWVVLHFSGSELFRDPLVCATNVLNVCKQKTDDWTMQVQAASALQAERDNQKQPPREGLRTL